MSRLDSSLRKDLEGREGGDLIARWIAVLGSSNATSVNFFFSNSLFRMEIRRWLDLKMVDWEM